MYLDKYMLIYMYNIRLERVPNDWCEPANQQMKSECYYCVQIALCLFSSFYVANIFSVFLPRLCCLTSSCDVKTATEYGYPKRQMRHVVVALVEYYRDMEG